MRRALERSLLEQGSPQRRERGALPPPREGSDLQLRRALQQSLEEEELRRCLSESPYNSRVAIFAAGNGQYVCNCNVSPAWTCPRERVI